MSSRRVATIHLREAATTATMAAAGVTFENFSDSGDSIDTYLERLERHFLAIDLSDSDENANRRKAILLSSIGAETYKVLKDLCYPNAPAQKTYAEIGQFLTNHYKPNILGIAERFRFHSTKQLPTQTISAYAAHLQNMAATCEFVGDQLKDAL